jgi:hypothetical protein
MKQPRADAKLKNLPEEAQEALWRLRHPSEGEERKPMTMEELQTEVPLRYGFTISMGSLSEWHNWYALKRGIDNAVARAEQLRAEMAQSGSFTAEQIERAGQVYFMSQAVGDGDPKTFFLMAKIGLQREQQSLDREKLTAATRSKIDAGLDQLFVEIKGNQRAEKLFAELKEVVSKA